MKKPRRTPKTQSIEMKKPHQGLGDIYRAVAIVLITLVVYIPAMQAGFIWDDDTFLTNNRRIKASDGLYRFWFTTEAPDYFPLTSSMLWVEWRLWGMNATGYHVVNVLLHAVSSMLLWLVLRRLKIPGAWLAGLVFAVHPVNVESVAWITERKNTLPMVFYLLSMLLYLRFEAEERRRWYALSLFTFLLALLSKTSVVMLPFVLLLCAWWQRGEIGRRDLLRSSPFFALSLILGLVTVWFQTNVAIGDDVVRADGFFSRLAVAGWAVWFYLGKALFPVNLSFVYPKWSVDASSLASYVPAALLVCVFAVLWVKRRGWGRAPLFALGYYVLNLLPVLGFFDIYFMTYSYVADHWQYTALAGMVALAAGMGAGFLQIRIKSPEGLSIALAACLVSVLSILTFSQSRIYKDPETLWRDTLSKNPSSWLAHNDLGLLLSQRGRAAEAMAHFQEAVRLEPANKQSLNNLGFLLASQGRTDEAVSFFRRALAIDPGVPSTHYNLGKTLVMAGRHVEALHHLLEAVRIKPDHFSAHYLAGACLEALGRSEEALEHYRVTVQMNPGWWEARLALGGLLAASGRIDESVTHLVEAARLNPRSAEARLRLSRTYWLKGDKKAAREELAQLRKLNPGQADELVRWMETTAGNQ